jgi:hypothetical protein
MMPPGTRGNAHQSATLVTRGRPHIFIPLTAAGPSLVPLSTSTTLGASRNMTIDRIVWIGCVEVTGRPGNPVLGLDDAGAYVIALALASNPTDYRKQVVKASNALGLEVLQCDDIEPLCDRLAKYEVDLSVQELADQLGPRNPVLFDCFCKYPFEDGKTDNE